MDNISQENKLSGERIKKLRTDLNMSQQDLADALGLQKSAIAKYENGRVVNIKRSIIAKMSKLFNCSPSYIMGFEEDNLKLGNPEKLARLSMYDEKILEYADKLAKLPEEQRDTIFQLIDALTPKKPQDSE